MWYFKTGSKPSGSLRFVTDKIIELWRSRKGNWVRV
jgi:hypothetical protein